MSRRNRAIVLAVVQCLLVASVAAKYLYERATCPRVWARAIQYDPELPVRGRYLALSPEVDACELAKTAQPGDTGSFGIRGFRAQLVSRDGKLVAEDARGHLPLSDSQTVSIGVNRPCNRAQIWPGVNYYVPEHAQSPFPLTPGQELWVEVTVPPSGPPRPIQLALRDNEKWQILHFD